MNAKKTKSGEFLSVINYVRVNSVKGDTIAVTDTDGLSFEISGKKLIESGKIASASQFDQTSKISRTELIERVKTSNGAAITVNFDKADGTNRTIICHYVRPETELGRSYVKDLEDPKAFEKQIDHRTLHWAIIRNVKYTVK